MPLTAEQSQLFTALGLTPPPAGATAIDWRAFAAKALAVIEAILAALNQKPVTAAAKAGCCDHGACCRATMESALQTARLSLCHYEQCCAEECA